MDIKQIVFDALREQGCDVDHNESTDIVKVTCADGSVWDFTVPSEVEQGVEYVIDYTSGESDLISEQWFARAKARGLELRKDKNPSVTNAYERGIYVGSFNNAVYNRRGELYRLKVKG